MTSSHARRSLEDRVYEIVGALPAGTIVTYGEVAAEAGFPGAARAVGRVMATSEGLPWWRVVAANGRLVPGHEHEHTRRLRAEGVELRNGKVAMSRGGRAAVTAGTANAARRVNRQRERTSARTRTQPDR